MKIRGIKTSPSNKETGNLFENRYNPVALTKSANARRSTCPKGHDPDSLSDFSVSEASDDDSDGGVLLEYASEGPSDLPRSGQVSGVDSEQLFNLSGNVLEDLSDLLKTMLLCDDVGRSDAEEPEDDASNAAWSTTGRCDETDCLCCREAQDADQEPPTYSTEDTNHGPHMIDIEDLFLTEAAFRSQFDEVAAAGGATMDFETEELLDAARILMSLAEGCASIYSSQARE
ncbi:hypothetical protein HYFRA_00007224 [Hymenoscyphus fraxineus]|uniref:Uncharacterized protein n=1 Tax=Hymenoscyphus fraxineus TaxID=746836 RepID=A0A9N9PU41_9HELO|nr:hypothetical protein HYFRA_00007224 [Hymenoscyphus fraxineus]